MMSYLDIVKNSRKFMAYICIVIIVSIMVTYLINPDIKGVLDGVSQKRNTNITSSLGLKKVWEYTVNNGVMVPLQMTLLALLPIPFLYCINLTITAILPGILIGLMLRYNFSKGIGLIISALPHFLIELTGLCIFAALLYRLNNSIYNFLYARLRNKKLMPIKLKDLLSKIVTIYLIIVLPLIILAGVVETYVADYIFKLMVK